MKRHLLFAMLCIVGALNMSAQEDVTDTYLTNANLSSLNGWTQSGYTAWKTDGAVPVIEFWNWSTQFNFSQTVTLPAGNYRIAVNSFYRNSWTGDGTNNNMAWIFAGSQTKNVVALNSMSDLSGYSGSNDLYKAATAFSLGNFSNEFDFDVAEESTIELGFRGTCPDGGWCILGPVKLYKYSLEDYLVDYRAKVAEAQALNEADMFPTAWANLQAAIVDESTFSLVSEVTAAINTLSAAINAANTSISIKSSTVDKLAKMKEITEATNFYTDAAYETYYGQWKAKYDAGTLTEEEANGLQDPYATTGWHDAITVDDFLLSSWDVEPNFAGDYYINTWSTEDNNNGFGTPFFEYWVGSGSLAARTMTATIVGLEANQLYSVEILARTQVSGTKVDNSIRMQVGDGTAVDLTAGDLLAASRYLGTFTAIGTTDDSGTLTVTLTVDANSGISWLSWKNLKYQQIDDERIPYAEQLAQIVAQAQSLTTTLVVPDGVKATLNSTAGTYDGYTYTSLPTVAAFQEAIAAVQAAIADAQDAEATYAKYNELKGYATDLLAVDYVDLVADAHATYAAAQTEPTLNTKTDIDAAYEALYIATMTYVENADPATGEQFDLTFLLVNPDVTSYWDGTWGIVPAGWYTDQTGGNFQVMANNEMGPDGEVFIEYWSEQPKTSGFVLYQKVTIPKGTYKMTGRVGLQQSVGGTTANMTFSANETDGSQIAVGTLADQEVEFVNTTEQEVKIGLKAQSGNCYRWIGINKIKMYKVPTSDNEYNIVTSVTNATVSVTVDDVEATTAKKLDAVKFTVTLEDGVVVESIAVTYVDGDNNTQTITPTDLGGNVYTFQMPAYDVTITVVAVVDKTALETAITNAGSVDPTTVEAPAEIVSAFTTALSTANDVYAATEATPSQVAEATTNLVNAQNELEAAIPAYAAYLELKDYADALVAAPTDNASAQTTLATAISTAETDINAVTTAAEAAGVNSTLKAAMVTYAGVATPTDKNQPFNLTFMFVNPNLEGLPTWQPCEGWLTEQPDGNSQVMTNDAITSEDGTKTAVYEYWSYTAKSNGLFTLYQPVTLPEGTYSMSCYAFAKQQNDPANTGDVVGVFFYANDTQGSAVSSDRLAQKTIEFVNAQEQEVKIGLKAINPNTYNWMGIGYLELYKIPANRIVIDPDDPQYEEGDYSGYDYTQEIAGDVELIRPIKDQFNAVVLPFSMTQQEVEDYFGQDSKVYIVRDYYVESDILSFEIREGVQANQPCLIRATENHDSFVIEGRTLVAANSFFPEYAPTDNVKMTGVYVDELRLSDYDWYIKGGELVYAPAGVNSWINMTRAYITITGWEPDPTGVKTLKVSFDGGEATAIATIENGELNILNGKVFDLSGREVKNPTRGIYIIDGKKVMIK